VAHDVDFPRTQPIAILRAAIALHSDAGVGTEQVDEPVSLEDLVNQQLDVGLAGYVHGEVPAADLSRDFASGFLLDISDYYGFGALGCETPA
jgi:hypothetical protein